MKLSHTVCVMLILCTVAAAGSAQVARARIVWQEGAPHVQVQVAADVPENIKELTVPLTLFDSSGKQVWSTNAKVQFAPDKPSAATVKLEKIEKAGTAHRVHVALDRPDLDIAWAEDINFAGEKDKILAHGIRREGIFPNEHVFLVLRLNSITRRNIESIDLAVTIRDADDNVVLERIYKTPIKADGTDIEIDITPPPESVGPYELEYGIENDQLGIYFNATSRFAYANVMIPVTSIEVDDNTWFSSQAADPNRYTTGAYYYSKHLTDTSPNRYPAVAYDDKVFHSGRRSLRIDYTQGRDAYVYSRVVLPGFPTAARIWVKGNNTNDTIRIHWCDNSDDTRQAWRRSANFSHHQLCTLNFEGWRSFRVPVLGEGMQVTVNLAGSSPGVDAPVSLLALSIHSPRPGRNEKPRNRTIWIDDLQVETQAHVENQVSMELRTDTTDRLLHENAKLFVSIGNGSPEDVEEGILRLIARGRPTDADAGAPAPPLFEHTETIRVPSGGVVVTELPLKEIHAKSPLGPVDVDVTFAAPAIAGLRTSQRITLKAPKSYGLFWDFEKPEHYNGFWGAGGADCIAGGHNSERALAIALKAPKPNPNPAIRARQDLRPNNCVILHPALPGMPDRIEVMVRGNGKPITLQPFMVDGGLTGIWLRYYNVFWMPEVSVDWQGWRKIELVAPRVPANYDSKNKYFLFEPYYPLNLCFKAWSEDPEAQVFIDNIRVRTHLLPSEELMAEIDYPDDTCIHKPGAPLQLVLTNFAAADRQVTGTFKLESYQEYTAAQGKIDVTVPAGQKVIHTLIPSLAPGIYTATVHIATPQGDGARGRTLSACIQVLDATQFFGPNPLEFIKDVNALRQQLGMTVEEARLDWDNMEAMPGMFHFAPFYNEAKKASHDGAYSVLPIVGFAADWTGPHTQESIARGTYSRYIGDYLQAPVRLVDWSRFVREVAREYATKFPKWVFWENPDLDGPQGLRQDRYAQMLAIFAKWFKLYNPHAKIVAGGFNYDTVLSYLDRMENPADLAFDEITVQMNVGELTPEEADIEGLLDELNSLLDIQARGRTVQLINMDWPIGEWVSPLQHAAYHARTLLILNSRRAPEHRFNLANSGRSFDKYGVFHSRVYGNSDNLEQQLYRPWYVPKPAYFSLMFARRFLARWHFRKSVTIPDSNLTANRAYIYTDDAGKLSAVVWRATGSPRTYRLPYSWRGAAFRDGFGFPLDVKDRLRLATLPTYIELPTHYSPEQLAADLRLLQPDDGKDIVLLDLYIGEPDSCKRAKYSSTGAARSLQLRGKLPAGRKISETFLFGLESEQFEFTAPEAGPVLMSRRWQFSGEGQELFVQLNGGPEQTWDLTKSAVNAPGLRESTFILRDCVKGANIVRIRYEKPGNCSGYRIEPLPTDHVPLARWGIFNVMQTKGELQRYKSASGTPLTIGKKHYSSGLGAHAVSLVEYPLDGQFSSFEVTVGIDAVTDGRGSVVFEVLVDGKQRAQSERMTGFSKPQTLKVDELGNARRLSLVVKDGGDGNQDDLADWVDGKLFLK